MNTKTENIELTDADILKIAEQQKLVIWIIIANLLTFWIPIAEIAAIIAYLIVTWNFTRHLRVSSWIFLICSLIPLVNTFALAIVNRKAIAVLRSRGIRVGFMGAKREDLERLA